MKETLPSALYRAAQVRELDRRAIEVHGIPGYTLMNRAGCAAFASLQRRWPHTRSVTVVCGAGNNGGDGYVIARLAHEHGLAVEVLALADLAELQGDARRAWQDAVDAEVMVKPFTADALTVADVIVDAVFGTGLSRPVAGRWLAAIHAMNAATAPILAVDIPSGLQADTGAILGAAIRADHTISFIGLKQGLLTAAGPDCCGTLEFADLDVPQAVYADLPPASQHYTGYDRAELLPARARSAHKGDAGHLLIIGGDYGYAGAVRMAAEAAARCGAGLVTVATRVEHAVAHAAQRPEIMFRGVDSPQDLGPLVARADVMAIGPGLGTNHWGRTLLDAALTVPRPLLFDADALNLLAQQPFQRDHWVLTPHPGEAARLLGSDAATVQADRFAAVQQLVQRYGGVVVLKGAGSLVAAAEQTPQVITAGNPGMASGGMGDVLTGIIASLMVQGVPLCAAARLGVWLHAMAADQAAVSGERGLLAGDLMPELRGLVNP